MTSDPRLIDVPLKDCAARLIVGHDLKVSDPRAIADARILNPPGPHRAAAIAETAEKLLLDDGDALDIRTGALAVWERILGARLACAEVTEFRVRTLLDGTDTAYAALWLIADAFLQHTGGRPSFILNPFTRAGLRRFPSHGPTFALSDWVTIDDRDGDEPRHLREVTTKGMTQFGLPEIAASCPPGGEHAIGNAVRAYAFHLWSVARGNEPHRVRLFDEPTLMPSDLWMFWGTTAPGAAEPTVAAVGFDGETLRLRPVGDPGITTHVRIGSRTLTNVCERVVLHERWLRDIEGSFPPLARPYTTRR
ncbi:hypothetical protein GCM10022221_68030 [Actinocorallia aurea]